MALNIRAYILKALLTIISWLFLSFNSYSQTLHINHESPFGNLGNNNIKQVIQDRLNYIWILGSAGLSRYNGSTFTTLLPANNNKLQPEYQFITEDAQGIIWLATKDHLILLTHTGNDRYSINKRAIPGIKALQADPTAGVWVLSTGAVIHVTANDIQKNHFHNNIHSNTNNPDYLSIDDSTAFAVSHSTIYLTSQNGIQYLDRNSPNTWQLIELQHQPTALAYSYRSEALYATDNHGLYSIKNNEIILITETPDKQNTPKLHVDTEDGIWSFDEASIWRIGRFGETQHITKASIGHPIINDMLFSRENQLFIATKTGLSIIRNTDLTHHQNLQTGKKVFSINADSNHNLLITGELNTSTYNKNLKHLRLASPEHIEGDSNLVTSTEIYYPGQLLTSKKIRSNTFALGGNQGLYYGNRARLSRVKALAKHRVHALHLDIYKSLWVATDKGLYKFDSDMQPVRFISHADMPSHPINPNAMHSDQDLLYIGTNNGLITLDLNFSTNNARLNISLRNFSNGNNNRIYQLKKPIPYPGDKIQFIFDSIYHSNLEGLQFQYHLDGYEKNWSPATTLNLVNYTRLPPGSYQLRTRAMGKNTLGVTFHSTIENYNFKISPPWWLNSWAKLTYVATFLLILTIAFLTIKKFISDIKIDNNRLRKKNRSIKKNKAKVLRENNDIEKNINHDKSIFLSKIGHNIHQPINTIINLSKPLSTSEYNTLEKRKFEKIFNTAENILSITTDILDISKIEANNLQLKSFNFDLLELLESTIKTLTISAKQKGLYLNTITEKDVSYAVQADKSRIHQILFNIINNAIKFTESGGITVNLKKNPPTNSKHNFYFSVRDTGIGIAPENIDRVFTPFRQISNGGNPDLSTGSGLGLSISEQLVKMMGGKIHVDSAPGRGSRFYFNLELAIADPTQTTNKTTYTQAHVKPQQNKSKLKVLMAEDNYTNVIVAETHFKQHDLELTNTGNGIETLDALRKNQFDIILMDLEMPLMGGYECARRIRDGEGGQQHKDIPIIALSAHAIRTHKHQTQEAGIQHYLTKPVEFPLLFQYIQRCCEKSTHKITTQHNSVTNIHEDKEEQRRQRFILVFLQESEGMLNEFKDAIEGNNYVLLENIAHKYKSSAGMLQLNNILKLLKSIEFKAQEKLISDVAQSVEEIKQELHRIQTDIDAPKTGSS